MLDLEVFIFELLAIDRLPSRAVPGSEVATLDHEPWVSSAPPSRKRASRATAYPLITRWKVHPLK